MNTAIIKSFSKITILTLIFFVLFNIGNQVINAWWWSNDTKTENKEDFKSIDDTGMNEVGVAISLNIGTEFYEGKIDNTNSFYNDVVPIAVILSDSTKTKEIIITKNVEAIKDYINISKIDVKGYLESGDDKQATYDSLINQLKVRYITGYANSKNLELQIETLVNALKGINQSIDNTKQSIALNMKSYNSKDLNKNIDAYLELKKQYTILRTYSVFCNQFLNYYKGLNIYNRNVLNNLKLNENAIVNNSYIVIPASGSEMIRNLGLIYDENNLPDSLKTIDLNNGSSNNGNINTTSSNSNSSTNLINNFSTDYNSTTNFGGTYNTGEGIFGDPYNMKNYTPEKASGGMKFGTEKLEK